MHRVELPRLAAAVAEAGQDLHRIALDHVDLHVRSIGNVEILLLWIFRQGYVEDRSIPKRILEDEQLFHERAIGLEHLDTVVGAVADVQQAILGKLDAVNRSAELLGGWIVKN